MAVPVDAITHKRLILVKQLYQNAVIQSASQHSIISRILAVIGFDLAVETIVRAIISSLDPAKSPSDGFQGLIQQADLVLANVGLNPVPDKANVQHVHSIRNDAQHKAKYPNESDVSDCRTYIRDFLQKVSSEIWGLNFEKISLTDIIQHENVKQFMVAAETALSQGSYREAVQQAAAGLTWALNHVETAVVGRMPPFASAILLMDGSGQPASDADCRNAYRALERMQDTLLYISLGMNYSDYMQYRQIAGHVVYTLGGQPHYSNMKANIEANEAEFVVAYCTDTVVQIESRVGSLDAPFGSDRWY